MKPYTDKILWSAIIQSLAHYANDEILPQHILPHTNIKELFKEDSMLFFNSLEKIADYFQHTYQMRHVKVDIRETELFEVFEMAEDVYLYFYVKIHQLDKTVDKIQKGIEKKNS